jgi:hypothetical protein
VLDHYAAVSDLLLSVMMLCSLTFMASGMAAATLSNSAAAADIAPVAPQLEWPTTDVLRFGLLLLGSAVLTFAALAGIAKQVGVTTASRTLAPAGLCGLESIVDSVIGSPNGRCS